MTAELDQNVGRGLSQLNGCNTPPGQKFRATGSSIDRCRQIKLLSVIFTGNNNFAALDDSPKALYSNVRVWAKREIPYSRFVNDDRGDPAPDHPGQVNILGRDRSRMITIHARIVSPSASTCNRRRFN